MQVLRYGREAALVEVESLEQVIALHADLTGAAPVGVIETVPAARTLLIRFDPSVISFAALAAEVATRKPQPRQAVPGPQVEIPIRYDGPDIEAVAATIGITAEDLTTRHQRGSYTVALLGLAPGFYFLAGLDESLQVARRPSPRAAVPKGAIGLAGDFCGIYPRTGPGGWQLIGTTEADLWDLATHPSARLAPGTTIRFVPA